jgi:predicted murein hydrolase (TIGR00659 family)
VIARLAWFSLTVALYAATRKAQAVAKGSPLLNPVLLSAAVVILVLGLTRRDASEYRDAGAPLLWLLGPATVALAVPLYRALRDIQRALAPVASALVVGSTATVVSAVALGTALGAMPDTTLALAAKSVTTPIAMAITGQLGGMPPLAAVFVMITGSLGAVFGGVVLHWLGVRDQRARGFAMGIVAHGMGTARAFQESTIAGTFSGIAMTINGVLTAIVLPIAWLLMR